MTRTGDAMDRPWDVLRSGTVPTVMLELGHLTHPVERRLMVSRDYHREVADALVERSGRCWDRRPAEARSTVLPRGPFPSGRR